MRSSFEDLVARDLMVKMDLQSDFSFKKQKIQKDFHMHAVIWRSLCAIGRVGGFDSHHTRGR